MDWDPSRKRKTLKADLPAWARGSGLDDAAVVRFLAFMKSQGVWAIGVQDFGCTEEHADPLRVIAVSDVPESRIRPHHTRLVCRECSPRCSYCDEWCYHFYYRPADDGPPTACFACAQSLGTQ